MRGGMQAVEVHRQEIHLPKGMVSGGESSRPSLECTPRLLGRGTSLPPCQVVKSLGSIPQQLEYELFQVPLFCTVLPCSPEIQLNTEVPEYILISNH